MAVEGGSHLFGRAIEVAGELHFLVADRGNFGPGTVEVGLHLVAHAVELHAELIDLVVRRGFSNSVGEQRSRRNGGGGLKERAAIHHRIFSRCGSKSAPLYAGGHSRSAQSRRRKCAGGNTPAGCSRARCYFDDATCRLFVTEKMPETLLARIPAKFLSPSLSTTPSSVTLPFLTMMRIGFCTPRAYFSSAGYP